MRFIFAFFTFFLLFVTTIHAQEGPTLFLNPATQSVTQNQTFSVEIRLNTVGQSINTVAANLLYDKAVLTPQSIDTTGSFVTIWFENNIASSTGEVRLTGSLPSPGVTGQNLLFATVNFSAQQTGTSQITFKDDSAVFRDSDNANVLSSTTGGVYTIAAADTTPTPTSLLNTTPTLSPTPTSQLPNVGTTQPTIMLFLIGTVLLAIALALLVY